MQTIKTLTLVIISFLFAVSAFAHDGNEHVKGVVTAIADNTIALQTPTKETVTIHYDSTTKFEKSGVKAEVKDLKVGERAVIDIHKMDGKLHGTLVRFGTAKKASPDHGKEKH